MAEHSDAGRMGSSDDGGRQGMASQEMGAGLLGRWVQMSYSVNVGIDCSVGRFRGILELSLCYLTMFNTIWSQGRRM